MGTSLVLKCGRCARLALSVAEMDSESLILVCEAVPIRPVVHSNVVSAVSGYPTAKCGQRHRYPVETFSTGLLEHLVAVLDVEEPSVVTPEMLG